MMSHGFGSVYFFQMWAEALPGQAVSAAQARVNVDTGCEVRAV